MKLTWKHGLIAVGVGGVVYLGVRWLRTPKTVVDEVRAIHETVTNPTGVEATAEEVRTFVRNVVESTPTGGNAGVIPGANPSLSVEENRRRAGLPPISRTPAVAPSPSTAGAAGLSDPTMEL